MGTLSRIPIRLLNFNPLNSIKEIRTETIFTESPKLSADLLPTRGILDSRKIPVFKDVPKAPYCATKDIPETPEISTTKSEAKIHKFWTSAFPNLVGENGLLNFQSLLKQVKSSQKLVQEFQSMNSKLEKMSKGLESLMESGGFSKIMQYGNYTLNPINLFILSTTGTLAHLQKIHDNLSKLFSKIEDNFEDGF